MKFNRSTITFAMKTFEDSWPLPLFENKTLWWECSRAQLSVVVLEYHQETAPRFCGRAIMSNTAAHHQGATKIFCLHPRPDSQKRVCKHLPFMWNLFGVLCFLGAVCVCDLHMWADWPACGVLNRQFVLCCFIKMFFINWVWNVEFVSEARKLQRTLLISGSHYRNLRSCEVLVCEILIAPRHPPSAGPSAFPEPLLPEQPACPSCHSEWMAYSPFVRLGDTAWQVAAPITPPATLHKVQCPPLLSLGSVIHNLFAQHLFNLMP